MNPYIGHETQLSGVEEHRLVGGKGDGMRLYEATNGKGLELTLSPDRNGDIILPDAVDVIVVVNSQGFADEPFIGDIIFFVTT